MAEVLSEPHVWVNQYETCNQCNFGTHRCYFCGADLDHEGWDTDGNNHTVAFCRPDLVEHEPGPTCTWPVIPEMGDVWNREHDRPGCYWDHEKNQLRDRKL